MDLYLNPRGTCIAAGGLTERKDQQRVISAAVFIDHRLAQIVTD